MTIFIDREAMEIMRLVESMCLCVGMSEHYLTCLYYGFPTGAEQVDSGTLAVKPSTAKSPTKHEINPI